MNKIKVIDLFNMISKGEEVPKKIKFDDIIFEYDGDYYSSETNALLEGYCYLTTSILNDEVEVIEDKKIEKLDLILDEQFSSYEIQAYIKETQEKVNEIIDKINKD